MATRIQTQLGDVLILQTTRSYTIYAVGRVSKDGQQDFGGENDVTYHLNDFQSARVLPGIVASQRLPADLVNVV